MNTPGGILFISEGGENPDSPGLRQALKLAHAGNARLVVLSLYPDLPERYRNLQESFEEFLKTELLHSIETACRSLGMAGDDPDCSVIVRKVSRVPLSIAIIREVISAGYDLVIKDADSVGGQGFRGMDMTLLRKCPSPVWLARSLSRSGKGVRIMVAVDPESREPGEHELSLGLLKKASALAGIFDGTLTVVSCWEFEFEKILRYKAWLTIPESDLVANREEVRTSHKQLLDKLVEESGMQGKYRMHHLRGRPEEVIPGFIEKESIDILVMGSVGRTGIPGFLIGNTAENVFEQISCTLLAMKPSGFVSPVTMPGNLS